MSRRFDRWRRVWMIVAAVTCLAPLAASKKSKDEIPAVRWPRAIPAALFRAPTTEKTATACGLMKLES